MNETLGTIKFLEDKIVTKKEGVEKIWKRNGNRSGQFIQHEGHFYYLVTDESEEDESLED